METENEEIKRLRAEILVLKESIKTLTDALKVLAEKDERVRIFIGRVEELLVTTGPSAL